LLRKKVFGDALNDDELYAVIADISAHRYSDIEISCFLSACAGGRLNSAEIVGLTRAMVRCGHQLTWPGRDRVFDKHCIGGLPGNRTTPLVVSIAGAAGLTMPKTSSRAITSPAGTADAMETLAKVDLSLAEIKRVVAQTGVCLAWGGAVELSPADDLLIRIERALDLDGEGQLIASVLSKKIAAGSTHAIIDIPVGAKAKVRSAAEGERLAALFTDVGAACGITVRCIMTDGSRPIGFGIGPVEEARDFLSVLRCEADAPQDLRERALLLAGNLLDLAFDCGVDAGIERAGTILDSGQAYAKFEQVVKYQGGFKALPAARFNHIEAADSAGYIAAIDNRQLARLAKLAGAPSSPAAGLRLHVNVGSKVEQGQPLFTLFSDSAGECAYAMHYYHNDANIFLLEPSA
jgi:thymidine phosphorylase